MRFRLVGLIALMALIVASCGGGVPEAAGPSEGIQVHGDWTIDVFNEDGSLDQHVEFSNALFPFGAAQIAAVLAGQSTSGSWEVYVHDGLVDLCPSTSSGDCPISPTVTVEDLQGDPSKESMRLAGSTSTEVAGNIDRVYTRLGVCGSTISPDACVTLGIGSFTTKDLSVPIAVTSGQIVQVQVDISFTSG